MGFDGFHRNESSPELESGSDFDFSSAFNIFDPTNPTTLWQGIPLTRNHISSDIVIKIYLL
jgi:hypothetical protein